MLLTAASGEPAQMSAMSRLAQHNRPFTCCPGGENAVLQPPVSLASAKTRM